MCRKANLSSAPLAVACGLRRTAKSNTQLRKPVPVCPEGRDDEKAKSPSQTKETRKRGMRVVLILCSFFFIGTRRQLRRCPAAWDVACGGAPCDGSRCDRATSGSYVYAVEVDPCRRACQKACQA